VEKELIGELYVPALMLHLLPTYQSISESIELVNVDLMTALIAYRNAHKNDCSKFPNNKVIKDDQLKQLMFLRQQVSNGRIKSTKRKN
jgi:hypothetical protein